MCHRIAPALAAVQIGRARDVHAGARNYFRRRAQIEGADHLLRANTVARDDLAFECVGALQQPRGQSYIPGLHCASNFTGRHDAATALDSTHDPRLESEALSELRQNASVASLLV